MKRINGDLQELTAQASVATTQALLDAVKGIDSVFGSGYAGKNPILVAAFIQTSTLQLSSTLLSGALEDLSSQVAWLASCQDNQPSVKPS